MDTLHSVLRNIRGETKSAKRDHLTVFREFLDHLNRIQRAPKQRSVKGRRGKPARRGK